MPDDNKLKMLTADDVPAQGSNGDHLPVEVEKDWTVGPQGAPGLTDELGTSGLLRTGNRGFVYEEFLRDLAGQRARQVYREMRDNDNVIGAIFYAVEMMMRSVTWRVEGENEDSNEFIEQCMEDMSHPWEDLIAEILSMCTYGWSWHEIVYKRRLGDSNDPSKRSKFNDGKIGWRKMPIRAQETLWEWLFDDEGGVQGVVQVAPPFYKRVDLPIERCALFRVGIHKGNPEGRSLLRNAYRSWFMKRRIEEIEAIGIERDMAGLPVIYRTGEVGKVYDAQLRVILRNIRRDEQEGLLLPLVYMPDGKTKALELSLLTSGGRRQFDTNQTIDRYNKSISMTVLADFIMLGQSSKGGAGSYALAENKSELFGRALEAILHMIASVVNRFCIPKLMALNGLPLDEMPKVVAGPVYTPDLKDLSGWITALAGAGCPLFPDNELEDYCRALAYLPKKSDEATQQQAQAAQAALQQQVAPSATPKPQPLQQAVQRATAKPKNKQLLRPGQKPGERQIHDTVGTTGLDHPAASQTAQTALPEDATT